MGFWDGLAEITKDRDNPVAKAIVFFALIAVVLAMILFPFAIVGAASLATDFMRDPKAYFGGAEKCFDLKEIGGKLYRVNQCNGVIEEFSPKK